MNVEGCVKLRSSAPSFRGGAPGESVIYQLNPQREKKILAETGWRRLEPGSLNLCVDDETVASLLTVKELIFELPDEINYPDGWQHIPQRRGGYKPGFPISPWYRTHRINRRVLSLQGSDARSRTTEGDTWWVKKKTVRFSSHSTAC